MHQNILSSQTTAVWERLKTYGTKDGGACQHIADLWCTYAATRALAWLNTKPLDIQGCKDFVLNCQNGDGGFAWQRGMRSDIWATYYCTQTLAHLGCDIPRIPQLKNWLGSLLTVDGGFAMTPGQLPDIWATYYAVRTLYEIVQQPIANPERIYQWLCATQQMSGGLGWNTQKQSADVRACYYGTVAARVIDKNLSIVPSWDLQPLRQWLQNRQYPSGGFAFQESSFVPCLWATFRAVRALNALESEPINKEQCIQWILERKKPLSGFCRWENYTVVDVWACFSAVGALDTLGYRLTPTQSSDVVSFLQSCQMPGTGFTYREPPYAGDSLATAAIVISDQGKDKNTSTEVDSLQKSCTQWLQRAHMPFEDGVMYMPARGAEVRCTLWTLSALNATRQMQLDAQRITRWFKEIQNPDGGFGYWYGRGSDILATVSVLESLQLLNVAIDEINRDHVAQFLQRCSTEVGIKYSPGGDIVLATTCQGIRGFLLLGMSNEAEKYISTIAAYASKIGGYAAQPGGVPDLLSTYQAIFTQQVLGVHWEIDTVRRFLNKVRQSTGWYSWTPLSRQDAGPLATCLGLLLDRAVVARQSQTPVELLPLNL